MATIDSLGISISDMTRPELMAKIHKIRATRRTRPLARKSAPAKVSRAPNKKAPKQQDLFALANGMTTEAKAALAASLMKGVKK
jgi:hypothetical protein